MPKMCRASWQSSRHPKGFLSLKAHVARQIVSVMKSTSSSERLNISIRLRLGVDDGRRRYLSVSSCENLHQLAVTDLLPPMLTFGASELLSATGTARGKALRLLELGPGKQHW